MAQDEIEGLEADQDSVGTPEETGSEVESVDLASQEDQVPALPEGAEAPDGDDVGADEAPGAEEAVPEQGPPGEGAEGDEPPPPDEPFPPRRTLIAGLVARLPGLCRANLKSLVLVASGAGVALIAMLLLSPRSVGPFSSDRSEEGPRGEGLLRSPQDVRCHAAAAAVRRAAVPMPQQFAGLCFEELIDRGDRSADAQDYASAARFYGAASEKEDADLPRVLFARHKLSRALLPIGRHEEVLEITGSLRSVSRPGGALWKHALVSSIVALGELRHWPALLREVDLLRVNCGRYSDGSSLRRWADYRKAMAKARVAVESAGRKASLYGMEPPGFGNEFGPLRSLALADVTRASGDYEYGRLRVESREDVLHVQADGVLLRQVLEEMRKVTGLRIECKARGKRLVNAKLEAPSADEAVEMIAGSVGLVFHQEEDGLVLGVHAAGLSSPAEAMEDALASLQEFLILHPESTHVAEAYYALAHLCMVEGQTKMALDQLQVLSEESPRSPWAVQGHYLAGRAWQESGNWRLGEREMLRVVDGCEDDALRQDAFLWAGLCQVEQGKYEDALVSLHKVLDGAPAPDVAEKVLYSVAFCTEKSGCPAHDVEEAYAEVKTRFPQGEHARLADYRLARMALEAGQYDRAAARYESYLRAWPIDDERGRDAWHDLLVCYLKAGRCAWAAALGQTALDSLSQDAEYDRILPLFLEACREAELYETGLRLIERSLAQLPPSARDWSLNIQKAGFLVRMGRLEEAGRLLDRAETGFLDEQVLCEARMVRARLHMVKGQPDKGLALCRQLALESPREETRARALNLMARHYESAGMFDKAALVFSGKCPLPGGGGE